MRKLLVSVLAVFLCFACVEQPLNVCKAGGGGMNFQFFRLTNF